MNLDDIQTKCFILALFIRDDKQRFLLGTGAYEFKDGQLHFAANVMTNDVVEVQGNDGYMLAGQVRRPSTQVFDGYIGDATVSKTDIENYRRDFFAFFQKNHYYTVVYVMPDGSAIQRRRGFIVDAGEVQELWQLFPEYHIGLNFEDVNYYKYSEDEDGNESYGKLATIGLSTSMTGGLILEDPSQAQDNAKGTNFKIDNTVGSEPVDKIDLYGDTQQQTYTGKNLIGLVDGTYTKNSVTAVVKDGVITFSGTSDATGDMYIPYIKTPLTLAAGTYTHSYSRVPSGTVAMNAGLGYAFNIGWNGSPATATINSETSYGNSYRIQISENINYNGVVIKPQLEVGSATSFEPYVGGTASPNPNYPQDVQVVKGLQTVTISDGDSQTQTYQIDLEGKNKFSTVIEQGSIDASTGDIANNKRARSKGFVDVSPSTEYTFNITNNLSSPTLGIAFAYDKNGNYVTQYPSSGWSSMPLTFTTGATIEKIRVVLKTQNEDVVSGSNFSDVQLELGGSATTYVAYRAIELCKIRNYQDYIYKSGDDWYVHKETGRVAYTSTDSFSAGSTSGYYYFSKARPTDASPTKMVYSNSFSFNSSWADHDDSVYIGNSNITFSRVIVGGSYLTTASAFTSWLAKKTAVVYYVLSTATDTQITDATLISELEALNAATTYSKATWFKSEADSLPAILWAYVQIILGGGVEWDNYGAVWEDGSSGGATTITVDSISTVYPVWTVKGPANSPTLTNITTGTSLAYGGNVSSSQTLVIDMLNQTAKLNGTSVIGNVSGNWIELAPGNNTINYSTTNGDAPSSTVEWQEVVG